MAVIEKINVFSLAKIQSLVTFFVTLVYTIIAYIISLVVPIAQQQFTWMVWLLPVIYGIIGFIMGAFIAFVYNLVAKWIGGLKIDLKK